MGSCEHGDYTHAEGEGGRLHNLNCPNWGDAGACLVSSSCLAIKERARVHAMAVEQSIAS